MKKKTILNVLKWLFVSASVLYLTQSAMMTLGILLLLLLIDALLAEYDKNRKNNSQQG